MNLLRTIYPVVVVLITIVLLGYPVALLFGLPLAKRDMEDLRKWRRDIVAAQPVADLSQPARLPFTRVPEQGILVFGDRPVDLPYSLDEGVAVLEREPDHPIVTFGRELERLSATVYSFGGPVPRIDPERAIYVDDRLALEGSVTAVEPPEGERTDFTMRDAQGPVIVDGNALTLDEEYLDLGDQVRIFDAPRFGADIRRVSGDYAVLNPDEGTIIFAVPQQGTVREASQALRLAEVLLGPVDGENQRFQLEHGNVVEADRDRALFVDEYRLSDVAERPEERVDGTRTTFTFQSETGIVTVDGRRMSESNDYSRDGPRVSFARPPARNAALRQYLDFFLVDTASGTIELAVPPDAGSVVWAKQYAIHSQPNCGVTLMECFYALPQHPVPFPHWIALRLGPFLDKYPLHDERNVLRATLYTTLGTLSALLLGASVGILLAVLFVLLRPLERALFPWVIASQTVPIIALVPVLLLILGNVGITIQTSMLPTAIIGAYIAFFPVVVGTVKGLRSIDPLSLDLMKTYAASRAQVFLRVRFPASVPFLFTSLKLGAAAALVGALVAETESNNRRGLGYQILGQVQAGNVADVWILLIVSALLGIALVSLISLTQRITAPWERK